MEAISVHIEIASSIEAPGGNSSGGRRVASGTELPAMKGIFRSLATAISSSAASSLSGKFSSENSFIKKPIVPRFMP